MGTVTANTQSVPATFFISNLLLSYSPPPCQHRYGTGSLTVGRRTPAATAFARSAAAVLLVKCDRHTPAANHHDAVGAIQQRFEVKLAHSPLLATLAQVAHRSTV